MARKRNRRARAAVATSIVAAASLAGIGTAAAAVPPEVCEKCDPGGVTVVLSPDVYQKWRSLAGDGVFVKLGEVFHELDLVFVKVEASAPVVDLFVKVEIEG